MTYMDASSLSEEREDWLRNGRRYRLGQYGIRDDGGTYSTYAVIGGRGYRTGAGLDSFAKSVRHIKGLVEPEDVTEHHYSDAHGIGSAEAMAGTEPTGSFAKVREGSRSRELRAFQSAADNPAFQSALASKYGDADRARSNRQARIQGLIDDGDCETAAYESLFVNHGGPLPDFMYDTEYGKKVLNIIANRTSKHANAPSNPYPVQLTKAAWPMRAILGMMLTAIHAEATGEMEKLSAFNSMPEASQNLMNVYGLMDALDEGERIKRDAGDPYKVTMYDSNGDEYIYKFNDYEASKYLNSKYPQDYISPGNKRIFSGFNLRGPSVYMDRKEREQRRKQGRWLNTYEPNYAMPSSKLGIRLANSGLPYEDYKRVSTRSNNPLMNGWTLDTTRPFEYGYVNGYSRNLDEPNNNIKRYAYLKARRVLLEENTKKFSTDPETARNHKKELRSELDRTQNELDGKLGEKEGFEEELKKLYVQLDVAKERLKEKDMSRAEYEELKQDIQNQLTDVYNNLSVLNREIYGLDNDSNYLSEKLTGYDEFARAQVDGINKIDDEMHELEANDEDVKRYLESDEPVDMVVRLNAPSMEEMYFETLLDLEKEDPMPLDESKPTERLAQRDENGRLILASLSPDVMTRLNNTYGPKMMADKELFLNTLHKTESETTRKLREAGELKDEERRLRNRTDVEKANDYCKARGIDDEVSRKLLADVYAARRTYSMTATSKGSTRSALDPHAQAKKTLSELTAQLAQRGVSMKDVDRFEKENNARVHSDLLQTADTFDGSTYKLREKQASEDVDDLEEYFGMNAEQAEQVERGEATRGEIAMKNLGFAMFKMFNKFGGNSNPAALADDRHHPVVERDQPYRNDDGTVSTMHLSSVSPGERENGPASAGHKAEGRILDALDAVNRRRNPKLDEPRMTEMEKLYAAGLGNSGDKKNAVSRRMAEELGVGQAVPGMVEPSADEPADEEADGMNDDGADETHDDGADDMNDRKDGRRPDDESDGFTKKAKSANDSRRSMSFREVMGEAASRNESAQGLPTWTDMAGADMRGCDVWKDLWRTVYMESGDGTPTRVRMKVIRDE